MKIVLVQPPNLQRSGDWKKMKVSRPPINLALLASYLRQFGHEPFIYDFDWFEGGVDEISRLILAHNPEVVGFTCLTPRIEITLGIAAKIKEFNPGVKIVLGGAHVNAVKEQSLYTSNIDYAIFGEAEEAFAELLKAIKANGDFTKIRNLIYRKGARVVMNPFRPFIQNLDELPFPAWDLLNLQDYKDPANFNGIHMGVMTTRGCPWNCIFCSSGVIWGGNARFRSAENVADELQHIVEKLGITNVMFYDDTFTLNKTRFLKICQEIVKRNLNLRYYCQLRVDTIDDEIADGLAKSGCMTAALGIESGDEEILKTLKKGFKKSRAYKAVAALKSVGVPVLASYIIGSPGDTHKSIHKTFELAKELDTNQVKFMICTPFPGTELFKMAVEKGILSNSPTPAQCSGITYYQYVAANMSKVSDEELLQYQRDAYSIFRPKKE
jgi:anaerobic magnesium-protoporphyrin IX monomethyl ester cyclase